MNVNRDRIVCAHSGQSAGVADVTTVIVRQLRMAAGMAADQTQRRDMLWVLASAAIVKHTDIEEIVVALNNGRMTICNDNAFDDPPGFSQASYLITEMHSDTLDSHPCTGDRLPRGTSTRCRTVASGRQSRHLISLSQVTRRHHRVKRIHLIDSPCALCDDNACPSHCPKRPAVYCPQSPPTQPTFVNEPVALRP